VSLVSEDRPRQRTQDGRSDQTLRLKALIQRDLVCARYLCIYFFPCRS